MNLKNYIITEENIISTYDKNASEHNISKAIKELEDRKLLPLDIKNQYFPEINVLTGIIYFTGNINKINNITLSLEEELRKNIKPLIKNINFELTPISNRKNCYQITGGGCLALGRYIQTIGVPKGNKKTQETHLPEYIREMMKTPKEYMPELTDFSAALLSSKASINKQDKIKIDVLSKSQKNPLVNETQELLKIQGINTTIQSIKKDEFENYGQRIYLGITKNLQDKKELFTFNDRKYEMF